MAGEAPLGGVVLFLGVVPDNFSLEAAATAAAALNIGLEETPAAAAALLFGLEAAATTAEALSLASFSLFFCWIPVTLMSFLAVTFDVFDFFPMVGLAGG